MLFLPNDDAKEAQSKELFESVVTKEGLKLLGWRQVPVAHEVVGRFAKDTQPRIWQVRSCKCNVHCGAQRRCDSIR